MSFKLRSNNLVFQNSIYKDSYYVNSDYSKYSNAPEENHYDQKADILNVDNTSSSSTNSSNNNKNKNNQNSIISNIIANTKQYLGNISNKGYFKSKSKDKISDSEVINDAYSSNNSNTKEALLIENNNNKNNNNSSNNKPVKSTSNNTHNEKAEIILSSLQGFFFDFYKIYESITAYHKLVKSYAVSNQEILVLQNEVKMIIKELPLVITKVKDSIAALEVIELKITEVTLKVKITEYKKNLNKKVLPKKEELTALIIEIIDKENDRKQFSKKYEKGFNHNKQINQQQNAFQNGFHKANNANNNSSNLSLSLSNSSIELDDNFVIVCSKKEPKRKGSFIEINDSDDSKARNDNPGIQQVDDSQVINDEVIVENNKNFNNLTLKEFDDTSKARRELEVENKILEGREKELNQIQKLSAQIKDISAYLNSKAAEQGKMLSKIDF